MSITLDTIKLAEVLRSKRGKLGLRAVAAEIGNVSAPTLSRIEQGKVPDVETFIKICGWLQVPTDFFILNDSPHEPISSKDHVVAHLRADRELGKDTIEMLVKMIDLAYASK
ncbi:MAG: XRE family transcriptional regulator [Pedobacter sp.]|nr:MAG: XRE family transcriptional regulator [Pedobacter sp.]